MFHTSLPGGAGSTQVASYQKICLSYVLKALIKIKTWKENFRILSIYSNILSSTLQSSPDSDGSRMPILFFSSTTADIITQTASSHWKWLYITTPKIINSLSKLCAAIYQQAGTICKSNQDKRRDTGK